MPSKNVAKVFRDGVEVVKTLLNGEVTWSPETTLTPPTISSVTITGTGKIGDVHTVSVAASGSPAPTFTYQWTRGGANISGATGATYTPVAADDETNLGVDVVATNSEGSDAASQDATVAITYPTPVMAGASISGTPEVGETLTAGYTASEEAGATDAYQWKRDGSPISGATSATYTLVSADAETDVTVTVTLTSSGGSDSATSAAVSVPAEPAGVANQGASFGVLTLANAGGFKPVDSNGGEVDLIAVTDQTGNTNNWSISSGRLVCDAPPAGDDALAVTCSHAGGSVEITIALVANAYTALTDATEVDAALDAIGSGGGKNVMLRAGTGGLSTALFDGRAFAAEVIVYGERRESAVDGARGSVFTTTGAYAKMDGTTNLILKDFAIQNTGGTPNRLTDFHNATNITLDGMTLDGGGNTQHGIYSNSPTGVDGLTIKRCYIIGFSSVGINTSSYSGAGVSITDNYFFALTADQIKSGGGDPSVYSATVPFLVARNFFYLTGFSEGAHPDILQLLHMSEAPGLVCRGMDFQHNVIVTDEGTFSQGFFNNPTPEAYIFTGKFEFRIRGNIFGVSHMNAIVVPGVQRAQITGNSLVEIGAGAGFTPRVYAGSGGVVETLLDRYNVAGAAPGAASGGTVTESDNIVTGLQGATVSYASIFDGPTFTPTTITAALSDFNAKTGGAAKTGRVGAVGTGYATFGTFFGDGSGFAINPLLDTPTGTKTGTTTATASVVTTEWDGTMYVVVTTSSSPPSAAQIKAGQDSAGASAAFSDSQTVTEFGAQSFSATGLTAGATYYAWFHHETPDGASEVIGSTGFTTDAAATVFRAVWFGQSEDHRTALTAFMGSPITVNNPTKLKVAYSLDSTPETFANPASIRSGFVTTADNKSQWLAELSNWLNDNVSAYDTIELAMQTCSGTGMLTMLDDSKPERPWANEWNIYDELWTTEVPDLAVESWYASQSGPDYMGIVEKWWFDALNEYDHAIVDRLPSTPLMVCGPHRFALETRLSIKEAQVANETYFAGSPNAAFLRGPEALSYLNGNTYDGGATWTDTGHPSNSTNGLGRHAIQVLGHSILHFGNADFRPQWTGATLAAASAYVEVSAASSIYTYRSDNSETPLAVEVQGFFWNDVPATEVELVGGKARVYWNTAKDPIPDGSVLKWCVTHPTSPTDADLMPDQIWKDWPMVTVNGVREICIVEDIPPSLLDVIPASGTPSFVITNVGGPFFLDPSSVGSVTGLSFAAKMTFDTISGLSERIFELTGSRIVIDISPTSRWVRASVRDSSNTVVGGGTSADGVIPSPGVQFLLEIAIDYVGETTKMWVDGVSVLNAPFNIGSTGAPDASRNLQTSSFDGEIEFFKFWKEVGPGGVMPVTTPYQQIGPDNAAGIIAAHDNVTGDGWMNGDDPTDPV